MNRRSVRLNRSRIDKTWTEGLLGRLNRSRIDKTWTVSLLGRLNRTRIDKTWTESLCFWTEIELLKPLKIYPTGNRINYLPGRSMILTKYVGLKLYSSVLVWFSYFHNKNPLNFTLSLKLPPLKWFSPLKN